MAAKKIKLTKNELQAQRGKLKKYERFLPTLQAVVDGFDDNHRIVDEHAEYDDDAQQDRYVERIAGDVQRPESTADRKHDAEGDERGNAYAEEQPANAEHEDQADECVGLHYADCLAGLRRLVIRQEQVDAAAVHRLVFAVSP